MCNVQRYYHFEDGQEAHGMTVLHRYLEMNWHKWVYDWKKKAQTKMADGQTLKDVRPDFISAAVWDQMCSIWDGETFKKMSAQRSAARQQSRLPHSTGSQSYDLYQDTLEVSLKHAPSRLEFWWHAHQKKGDGGYISPEAERIAVSFVIILFSMYLKFGYSFVLFLFILCVLSTNVCFFSDGLRIL